MTHKAKAVKSGRRQVTCRCGLYPFPHRESWACVQWQDDQIERQHEAHQHQRDLETWAALSRG